MSPGQGEAFAQRWQACVSRPLPQQAGFSHGYLGLSRATTMVAAISLWGAPPDLAALERNRQAFMEQVRDLIVGPPPVEDYEVLAEL